MDFVLSDDQEALRDGIRAVCAGRFDSDRVRAGFSRDVWKELADAGVFTSRDLGLGVTDAAVVFEELGRALVPGPLVWGWLAGRDDAVVGGLDRRALPAAVEHLDELDVLVVVDDDGVWEMDAGAIAGEPVAAPLDPLTPVHRVAVLAQGERAADADEARVWRLWGATLVAAQLVGVAHAACEQAVAYAKERRQFDRPIGSFQAIKHLLADMLVRVEVARAAVHAAGLHLDDPSLGAPERPVASAKLLAGEAALANGKASVQVHGGMGFTWEVDAHLQLKRAWVLDRLFGGADDQAEAVARTIG